MKNKKYTYYKALVHKPLGYNKYNKYNKYPFFPCHFVFFFFINRKHILVTTYSLIVHEALRTKASQFSYKYNKYF